MLGLFNKYMPIYCLYCSFVSILVNKIHVLSPKTILSRYLLPLFGVSKKIQCPFHSFHFVGICKIFSTEHAQHLWKPICLLQLQKEWTLKFEEYFHQLWKGVCYSKQVQLFFQQVHYSQWIVFSSFLVVHISSPFPEFPAPFSHRTIINYIITTSCSEPILDLGCRCSFFLLAENKCRYVQLAGATTIAFIFYLVLLFLFYFCLVS